MCLKCLKLTISDFTGEREEAEAASAALARDQGPQTPQQISEQVSGEEVQEEVMQYSRDPLETTRDGASTLYVWPIYMA